MANSYFRNGVIAIVLIAFLSPVHAGLVSTSDALNLEAGTALQTVEEYFLRDEVAAELAAYGVDPYTALARVEAMSPQEIDALAGRIDEMPAGGIITVLGITFLVLIILELVGVINIFNR